VRVRVRDIVRVRFRVTSGPWLRLGLGLGLKLGLALG